MAGHLMSPTRPRGMQRVRWLTDGEPEIECSHCFEWLPIVSEFWDPSRGLACCRACRRESTNKRTAAAGRRRRVSPSNAIELVHRRAMYAANIEAHRAYGRARYRRKYSTLARYLRECAA